MALDEDSVGKICFFLGQNGRDECEIPKYVKLPLYNKVIEH